MIAKFHSAPGHSMETTLTINIPPPERIRAAKGERLREKQKDKPQEVVQGAPGRIKDDENMMREKDEERLRKDDREREREKLERERRALGDRGPSYKDKFQKMREKYDKVTSTHDTYLQESEILNEKIKKLQAENDLLLDAVFLSDTTLYDRYFPSGPAHGPPPIGHPGPQQRPPQPPSMSSSSHSYRSSTSGHGHAAYAQYPNELPMGGPLQSLSASRFLDNPTASSSGPSAKLGHHYYHQSHGQNVEPQEQSKQHPFYTYSSREPMLPDPIHSPAHYRRSQHSTYRHYVPPSDHHKMPPPPPPISGSESEQRERQREKEWERERARREWEWERERPYKEFGGLPSTPPLVPAAAGLPPPPSNGYNSMTPNGHGYVHGPEYGHPPTTSATRTHARHGSRASRSNSSRSVSRRRTEGMKMEMDAVDADMPLPSDVDRSLGGPVHLDVDLEVARERENHSRSAERDHIRRDSMGGGGRRSRRNSTSQKPTMGHAHTPPMGILEPEQPQLAPDMRQAERRQRSRQERDREGYGYDPADVRMAYECGAPNPSGFHSWGTKDSDDDDYGQRRVDYVYEDGARHDRGGRWPVPGGRIENSGGMEGEIKGVREEEEEEEEEQADPSEREAGRREVMDLDEAN